MSFLDSAGLTRLWQHITAIVGTKVDKVSGKGLSTNDFTTQYKNKLDGIDTGANNYSLSREKVEEVLTGKITSHTHDYLPLSGGTLTNNLRAQKVSGEVSIGVKNDAVESDFYMYANDTKFGLYGRFGQTLKNVLAVPQSGEITFYGLANKATADAKGNTIDTTYATKSVATQDAAGLMSDTDKVKLDNMANLVGNTSVSTQISNALNGYAKTIEYSVILDPNNWSDGPAYGQTVTVNGILITDAPFIDVNMNGAYTIDTALSLLEAWGYVGRITTDTNSITVYCYEKKPTIALPINIKVVR